MKRGCMLAIAWVCLFGCASYTGPHYQFHTAFDQLDKYTSRSIDGNRLDTESGDLYLNVIQIEYASGETHYHLTIETATFDRIFIETESSLVLWIDGEEIELAGRVSYTRDDVIVKPRQGAFFKRAYYRIPLKGIERIADAKAVKVKVVGRSYSLAGEFTRKNSHNFQRFLADVEVRPQPPPFGEMVQQN